MEFKPNPQYIRPDGRSPTGPLMDQLDALEQSIDQTIAQAARVLGRARHFRDDQLLTHGVPLVLYRILQRVDEAAGLAAAVAIVEDNGSVVQFVSVPADMREPAEDDLPGAPHVHWDAEPRETIVVEHGEPRMTQKAIEGQARSAEELQEHVNPVDYLCTEFAARLTAGGFAGECLWCGKHEAHHPVPRPEPAS